MGIVVDGQAQVSMNLVDIDRTPLHQAFNEIARRAAEEGVEITWSEIIGLIPERALAGAAADHLRLKGFSPAQILERRLLDELPRQTTVTGFLDSLASSEPVPGGGTAVAHSGAVAASLLKMVAGLTIGRKKYAEFDAEARTIAAEADELSRRLHQLGDEDARAYSAVSRAYKLPRATDDETVARSRAIDAALTGAAEVPLETARLCARTAELAARMAEYGNSNAVSDSGVAALLAEAACNGAVYNVRINVAALSEPASVNSLVEQSNALNGRAATAALAARSAVDRAIGITR
jgi:glutamate formiminotransferase/formiminotetrahydrofolate cyclodeaminase